MSWTHGHAEVCKFHALANSRQTSPLRLADRKENSRRDQNYNGGNRYSRHMRHAVLHRFHVRQHDLGAGEPAPVRSSRHELKYSRCGFAGGRSGSPRWGGGGARSLEWNTITRQTSGFLFNVSTACYRFSLHATTRKTRASDLGRND